MMTIGHSLCCRFTGWRGPRRAASPSGSPGGTLRGSSKQTRPLMIEKDFNVAFIADLALREKQIQQNYRPVIAVHKWFARRPGALFRALILSEFSGRPVNENYYQSHHLPDLWVFDPFMGGGTTMVEANRVGCSVVGADINPMAWWIVRQELLDLDVHAYLKAAQQLRAHLEAEVGHLYRT